MLACSYAIQSNREALFREACAGAGARTLRYLRNLPLPSLPWDQRAYEEALDRGGGLSEYMTTFDDLCADRGFCAAQGYAPEDLLGRDFRKDKDALNPSGRCWDVLDARDHWRGVDPAHAPSDLSTWWRC